jgi:catechol 2,3-dioxygenase-like lactoylglutathione lyase family enzyme
VPAFPLAHISFAVADELTRRAWDSFLREVFDAETLYEVLIADPEAQRLKLDRQQTLLAVGGTVLYAAAPAGPGLQADSVIGNMLRAHAQPHTWIGVALTVADLEAAREWVRERGWTPRSYPLLEDRYFLLDRNDTLGMRLEFLAHGLDNDPRTRPGWSPARWRDEHPLGLEGLQSIGVSTVDLDLARQVFSGKLGWPEVAGRRTAAAECASFHLGETVIEAMQPLDGASALARHAHEQRGIWSLTFQVRSIEAAADYLLGRGLRLVEQRDRCFAIDPAQAFGRRLQFTDEIVEGYSPPDAMRPPPADLTNLRGRDRLP